MTSTKTKLINMVFGAAVLGGLIGCSGQDTLGKNFSEGWSIVGGDVVQRDDQVSQHTTMLVNLETNEICSGVLVSARVVLTAAHCLPANKENIKAYFSNSPLDEDGEVGAVIEAVQHPQYTAGTTLDSVDLAMLVLESPAPAFYQPVSIDDDDKIQIGKEVLLAGYGNSTAFEVEGFGRLRKVTANISNVSGSLFFEIDQADGRGICDGDSGGPVFQKSANKLMLIGIAKLTYDRDRTGDESCLTTSQYTSVHDSAIKRWILDLARKRG